MRALPPLRSVRVVASRRLRRLARDVRLRGDIYLDPICGGHFSTLLPATNGRPNALCPRCKSYERHRVLWLYLEREAGITAERLRVLHMAPEAGLSKRLRSLPNLDYTSADLSDPASMVKADITDLPFPDASFDLVLCNHVLEHVEDDRAAVAELARILTPQGRAIMQHPVDLDRPVTLRTSRSPTRPSGTACSSRATTSASTAGTSRRGCGRAAWMSSGAGSTRRR